MTEIVIQYRGGIWAMPFRPALARLRRSTRYAVFGLAAIAIAERV